jgi:hypothetical protein
MLLWKDYPFKDLLNGGDVQHRHEQQESSKTDAAYAKDDLRRILAEALAKSAQRSYPLLESGAILTTAEFFDGLGM